MCIYPHHKCPKFILQMKSDELVDLTTSENCVRREHMASAGHRRDLQAEASIVGYNLSDLKTSVTPANSAASDMQNVTVSFLGRSSIPAQTEVATNSFDRGILRIEMPEGFPVPTSTSTFCLYWSRLYEVGLSDAVAVSNSMSCQSEASNQITLHNRGDTELTAIEYVFNVTVRNPNYAQEARTWHFATYQSEAALDDDLIDEAYITGFPVNSRLPSVFMEALPAGQQSAGANATWVVRFELVNELLSGDSLVLIGPQEYEFDISGECRNVVSSLAAPSCSGNVLLVSCVGASDALVPNLGGTDRTVASLEFDVTVPTTKPVTNVAQLLHCRSESQLDIQDLRVAPCSNIIASRQYELWPVIPELTSLVVVACEGMNFTNTVATYLGESLSLLSTLTIGGVNSAHFSGDFVYENFESTNNWQIYLDGLKLNGAAVILTPCNCCFVEFVDTILSTQEYTVDCSAMHNAVHSVGRTVYEHPRGILSSPI